MSSLFGGGTAQQYQQQQAAMQGQMMDDLRSDISKYGKKGYKAIKEAKDYVTNLKNQNVDFSSPGHGIHVDSSGGFIKRNGETQGFMDALQSGLNTDETGYTDLLSQITPGFGRLSQAQAQEIENQGRAAVGNLREQLARRRVLGASFSNDQMAGLKATYDQMKNKALAESFVQEMEMTKQVIGARTEARNQTISQALQQIQFETDIGTKLTGLVMANNLDMAKLQTELASIAAQLSGNLAGSLASASGSMNSAVLSSMPQFAQQAGAEAAGPGNLLGSVLGMVAAPVLGGAGTALGNAIFPQAMSTFAQGGGFGGTK